MKPSGVIIAATTCLLLGACAKSKLPPVPPIEMASPPCADVAPWGFPYLEAGATKSENSRSKSRIELGFICRKEQYALGYDDKLRSPRWVVEVVSPENLQGDGKRVRNDYRADPFVPSPDRVTIEDYSKKITGENLGVISMASHKNVSANEMKIGRTFYMSNTLPAFRKGEDQGTWSILEDQVVKWAENKGRLIVVSGPLFANGELLGWTGVKTKQRRGEDRGNIGIPTHFFKVIVDEKTRQGISFIIPNDGSTSSNLPEMAKRISDVESISGINFFPRLSEDERASLTQSFTPSAWPIN